MRLRSASNTREGSSSRRASARRASASWRLSAARSASSTCWRPDVSTIERERIPRAPALIFGAVGLFLIPWAVWLALRLPRRHIAEHYDIAWAGFDVGLAI